MQKAGQLLDRAIAKFDAVLSVRPDLVPALTAAGSAYCDLADLLPPDSQDCTLAFQVRYRARDIGNSEGSWNQVR